MGRVAQMLDAAGELLLAHGYRRVTVEDVARRAGVGKGTVYLHFASKLELFAGVLVRESVDVTAELLAAWQAGDAAGFERILFSGLREHPEFAPLAARLFDERNLTMGARIEELLAERESLFVVVGAGHLVGPKGLVEILKGRGYSLEQLTRR